MTGVAPGAVPRAALARAAATVGPEMRVLGIDLGSCRIGLAISDADASFSFPLDAIESAGFARDVEAVRALIAERDVGCVVVGLPLHLDGREGSGADAARRFASALAAGGKIDGERR